MVSRSKVLDGQGTEDLRRCRLQPPRRSFPAELTVRVGLLCATLCLFAFLLIGTQAYAAILLAGVAAAAQGVALNRFVHTSNRELTRFISAMRHDDFSERFVTQRLSGSFADLHGALAQALEHLRSARADREADAAMLKVLIEHVPVALIAIDTEQKVEFLNGAARRLFGRGRTAASARLKDYGKAFDAAACSIEPGQTALVRMSFPDGSSRVKLSVTEVSALGRKRRLISIENIESELDATELGAWHDLVRVLTHEMMNSLTPVSSLADTARGLLDDLARQRPQDETLTQELAEIGDAVETIGRRSEGLLHFVNGYRRLTRVPAPERRRFLVSEVFDRLDHLMAPEMDKRGIGFNVSVQPDHLALTADPELLEQALINLLRNALDAVGDGPDQRITLAAGLDASGGVTIRVSDTGPGVTQDVADKIFVPFFTTKQKGSGVGLSVTRQVMSAHGGSIDLAHTSQGGAVFSLRFP